MAFLSNLFASAVAEPSGLWEWLILNVFNFISNYGWRVLFFTLCLKLLLSPLDIFQRYKARKNQKITEKLKPEIEKLKKQYPDPQVFQQKQAMLQKQSGISYFSSCLPAIATLVIFITLLNGLNNISAYMNFIEYKSYYDLYNETKVEYLATNPGDETGAVEAGQQAVYDYYQDNRTGWLWVKNIWSPDVPWASEINSKDTFITNIRDYGTSTSMSGLTTEEIANMKTEYNNVMGKLLNSSENQSNGYLILPILSVALSFLSQWLSMRQQKKSGQTNEMAGGGVMKMMLFIMPIMMGVFALTSTAAFSLYLVVQYAFSLIITLVSNLILFIIDKNEEKKLAKTVVKYGRPDPNDFN